MHALVTGATGYVGRELCRQLTAAGRGFVPLSCGGGALPSGRGTHAVDFRQAAIADALLEGIEVVYHLAGIAHQQAQAQLHEEVNYRATLALAEASERAGVRLFIYLSSVKAMGPAAGCGSRRENELADPSGPYGLSKWRAECALRERFSASAMAVVILRPALVYGPDPRGNLQWLLRAARWGFPAPPEGGARSMVGVEDLAELLLLLPQVVEEGVHTWIVTDGEAYTTRHVYQLLCEALGRSGGRQLPAWCWRILAAGLDVFQRQPRGSSYGKLFGAERYDNCALLQATGWQPRQTLACVAPAIVAGPAPAT
ncbi:NAD-dependent epimerase/dehydratase family protein [Haliea sp. E1-2-M8]|uniref:NAD-dependent epimerase/dehydratase family protein n=1 Tax=Haliea sp. E1-2-M8 TaxID=3064706 RepID=UPI00271B3A0D|nr:NAD-dependent epimerase/dehydratase family protein [Haliea sp. E1-2-M8]MDO8862267.1 NAD-dependent epimerase/dehydratase family protein [Haliea sp. E1-2-M8]